MYRLSEEELLPEAREHPTVLGAMTRAIGRPAEQNLADFLVGLQGLAVLPPLRRGILRTKRNLRGAALFERSFQLEQVTAELIRKERPHPCAHPAVFISMSRRLRVLEKQREKVLPVPVSRNEVHEGQNHLGEGPVQVNDELVKQQPLGLPPATPPRLEGHHEEVLYHLNVRRHASIFEDAVDESAQAVRFQTPDDLVEQGDQRIIKRLCR